MSLANFSAPFQVATPSPYLFSNIPDTQSSANLRLNTVPPSPSASAPFSDQRQYHNQPYIPPAAYQRPNHNYKLPQQHQYRTQNIPQEYASPDAGYNDYDEQDFRRTQPRQQQAPSKSVPQPMRSRMMGVDVHEPHVANHDAPRPSRTGDLFLQQPDGFTKVKGGSYGSPGAKTSVHAVLDYDDDDDIKGYDENIPRDARVTPIQGPIFLKNGSVPVVPLYSYPQYNNGSFVQIPILWTALSVALGVELRGDLVRGTPCIKKYHQLFCPAAGKTYPIERIELFIDENKALMKRMYGDFETDLEHGPKTSSSPRRRKKRAQGDDDLPDGGPSLLNNDQINNEFIGDNGDSFFDKVRNPRQSFSTTNRSESGRVDACESKVEIVTPYWASNSAGKVRAIVNTQHFEQAIHQEVCSKSQTNRCTDDCGCEQKYKWHRLLAYDPDDDCKGIFMDWFLFPSCCVCRCDPHGKFSGGKVTNGKVTSG